MRIVIAPQSFKGSLGALEVARSLARGVRQVFPEAELAILPIADGGEGTVRALVGASDGRTVTTRVTGPLGHPVNATWGILGDNETAVIEMAAASGLPLIRREQRNPLLATSFGTGELIRHALDYGLRRLIIGIGGSATNDGGAGMLQALGASLVDEQGVELPLGARQLQHLAFINVTALDARLSDIEVEVACDVNNPLLGPNGATAVYGPQKGAHHEMLGELEAGLARFADVIEATTGRDVRYAPGAGAAGGMGASLLAFLNADLLPGVDIVFRALRIPQHLDAADLVFTGEGRLDRQDIFGKAPVALAQLARDRGIPTVAVVGSTGRDYHVVYEHGIEAVIGTVNRPMPLDRAVAESGKLIAEAALRASRLIRVGMSVRARL